MNYRTAEETDDIARQAREAAKSKNMLKWEAEKLRAAKFVPGCLKQALSKVKKASERGDFWVEYKPPFWDLKYRFAWTKALRSLLKQELELRKFECSEEHGLSGPVSLRIHW